MTEIWNMTAHPVNVLGSDGGLIKTYEPSGFTFRLDEEWKSTGYAIDGIEVFNRATGDLLVCNTDKGSTEAVWDAFGMIPGRYYIVSAQVLNGEPDRTDFICPAFVQRHNSGSGMTVLGCLGFSSLSKTRCWRIVQPGRTGEPSEDE